MLLFRDLWVYYLSVDMLGSGGGVDVGVCVFCRLFICDVLWWCGVVCL